MRYADLQQALAERRAEGREANLADVAAAVRRVRQSKGMLMVEGDPDCRSAGSFFKNPVVTEEQIRQIAQHASAKEPAAFSGRAGRGESGPGQGSGRVADRAGRFQQGIHAGRCSYLFAAHAGARQSRRGERGGDSGAGRADYRRCRGTLWNSAGDGAGDGRILTRNKLPSLKSDVIVCKEMFAWRFKLAFEPL